MTRGAVRLRAAKARGLSLVVFAGAHGQASAQCLLDMQDTFRLDLRPHSANGHLRNVEIHDSLIDYWPELLSGSKWSTIDQSGQPCWIFAVSSTDSIEIDTLDEFNGTAFGDAEAVAVLPLILPPIPFTLSAEVVMPLGLTGSVCLGFSPSSDLSANLPVSGGLWVSLDGQGNWQMRANGSATLVAAGATSNGLLNNGWKRVEVTFDPATSMVAGKIGTASFEPTPVAVLGSMTNLVIEALGYWAVVNNLRVVSGTPLYVSLPSSTPICANSTASFTAVTNAPAVDPPGFAWLRDGFMLSDGQSSLGRVSGSATATLTITGITAATAGVFRCVVFNASGLTISNPMPVTVVIGGTADGDASGTTDGPDIRGFVVAIQQVGPFTDECVYDMNGDGTVDGADFAPFVAALIGS